MSIILVALIFGTLIARNAISKDLDLVDDIRTNNITATKGRLNENPSTPAYAVATVPDRPVAISRSEQNAFKVLPSTSPTNRNMIEINYATSESWLSSWMSHLPDNQPISLMTIPGTHNSCARYGGGLVKCQTASITEQLMMGVRFLDIRCRQYGGGFTIHHGLYYQNMIFGGVLDECIQFLDDHPTETILMRIKQEYSNAPAPSFVSMFEQYRTNKLYRGVPYRVRMVQGNRIPYLSEVRGKIVVISQVNGLNGIGWNSIDVQDDYHVPTIFHISQKWDKVRKHLEKAQNKLREESHHLQLFITFASGTGLGAFPYRVAKSINNYLYTYLQKTCTKCYYGVVALDYAGYYEKGLIGRLVKYNKNLHR